MEHVNPKVDFLFISDEWISVNDFLRQFRCWWVFVAWIVFISFRRWGAWVSQSRGAGVLMMRRALERTVLYRMLCELSHKGINWLVSFYQSVL